MNSAALTNANQSGDDPSRRDRRPDRPCRSLFAAELTIWVKKMRLPVAALLCALPAFAQTPADDFRQNCSNCHTIGGGRLTGPDLKGVTTRQDSGWLTRFVMNPKAVIDGGDAYARKLVDEAGGAVMPTIQGMTPERAAALLALIETESAVDQSQFMGLRISDQPLTPQDVARGRDLFTGRATLKNGGPACVSCHGLHGLPGLGGGRLGPDLTRVYERIDGREALAAWLASPPTQTMKPLFAQRSLQPDEILPLLGFIEAAAKQGGEAGFTGRVNFLIGGLAGVVLVLLGFESVWRNRFRAVRRPLVQSGRGDR